MSDRNAATALRLLSPRAAVLGTDNPDSLQNVNTTELPNGALCWVNDPSTPGLFQLNKIPGVTRPTGAIAPASGPGFWIFILPGSGSSGPLIATDVSMALFQSTNTPSNSGANEWAKLATVSPPPPLMIGSVGPLSPWSLDANAGVYTYNGQTRLFEIAMVVTFAPTTAAAIRFRANVDIGANLIGTTNTDIYMQEEQSSAATTDFSNISVIRTGSVTAGQTVVPIFASDAANRATTIEQMVMVIRAMQ